MTKVLVTQLTDEAKQAALAQSFPHLHLQWLSLIKLEVLPLTPADKDIIAHANWLVFSSQNAVKILESAQPGFFKNLDQHVHVAAVGKQTQEVLASVGARKVFVPARPDNGEHLAHELVKKHDLQDQKIAVLRAQNGRRDLLQTFLTLNLDVCPVDLYRTSTDFSQSSSLKNILKQGLDWITFSSPSAAKALVEMLSDKELNTFKTTVQVASIGSVTSRACEKLKLRIEREAPQPHLHGLLAAL